MNRVSIPGLHLYSSLQKHVSECAFDGYHWSNPKCYVHCKHRHTIQTVAQGRERKQLPWVPDSLIVKIKTAKISEIGILVYFTKITNHMAHVLVATCMHAATRATYMYTHACNGWRHMQVNQSKPISDCEELRKFVAHRHIFRKSMAWVNIVQSVCSHSPKQVVCLHVYTCTSSSNSSKTKYM